jgi:transposase-like protein
MNDAHDDSDPEDGKLKAGPKMFAAVAELVEKGLSPTRAAKVLKLSPDTVSRWRREYPEFAAMIDEAESKFIERMTGCISEAAKTDWRAAEAILARRFSTEFARDAAAVQLLSVQLNTPPPAEEVELSAMLQSPALRAHLTTMIEAASANSSNLPTTHSTVEPPRLALPEGS